NLPPPPPFDRRQTPSYSRPQQDYSKERRFDDLHREDSRVFRNTHGRGRDGTKARWKPYDHGPAHKDRSSHTSVYREVYRGSNQHMSMPVRHLADNSNLPRTPLAAGEAREETNDSNKNHLISDRGTPLQDPNHDLPLEAFNEALGEVREVMLQYTSTADPTENAARRERVRQAEKQGQLEETAVRIVRSSLANHTELQPTDANDHALVKEKSNKNHPLAAESCQSWKRQDLEDQEAEGILLEIALAKGRPHKTLKTNPSFI
ncbi:unnamed protein product, partial [Brassica oleracea var. botrytis]